MLHKQVFCSTSTIVIGGVLEFCERSSGRELYGTCVELVGEDDFCNLG
jgi:hypothetical protein